MSISVSMASRSKMAVRLVAYTRECVTTTPSVDGVGTNTDIYEISKGCHSKGRHIQTLDKLILSVHSS